MLRVLRPKELGSRGQRSSACTCSSPDVSSSACPLNCVRREGHRAEQKAAGHQPEMLQAPRHVGDMPRGSRPTQPPCALDLRSRSAGCAGSAQRQVRRGVCKRSRVAAAPACCSLQASATPSWCLRHTSTMGSRCSRSPPDQRQLQLCSAASAGAPADQPNGAADPASASAPDPPPSPLQQAADSSRCFLCCSLTPARTAYY